jgi:hypothetical protein
MSKLGSATKDPDRKPPEIGTLIGDAILMSGCPREPQFPKPWEPWHFPVHYKRSSSRTTLFRHLR